MKKIISVIFFSVLSINLFGQADYTGIYRYSFPVNRDMSDMKPTKEDSGPFGELILAKMEANNYSFWLNVNRGWPSYNMGYIGGKIEIINGAAIFSQKDEYSDGYCTLNFNVKTGVVEIATKEGHYQCGFGHAVYADGTFRKSKKILTNAYFFSTLQDMGDVKAIKSTKAIIYKDSNLQSPTKQYFIKADKVYTSQVTEKAIYVEYIAKGQKYIYGWIRKEDL